MEKLLKRNSMLVYEFDYVHQTALHWAAKRGFKEIAKLLIDYRSNVKIFDLVRIDFNLFALILFIGL